MRKAYAKKLELLWEMLMRRPYEKYKLSQMLLLNCSVQTPAYNYLNYGSHRYL